MLYRRLLLLGLALVGPWSGESRAQRGDRPGETQRDLPPDLVVPPAPVLSDADALASLRVAPGFHVELVASHPLLHDPVAFQVAPDGRIWVVEMRGYMHDMWGAGEDQPIGTVAVLDDTDGDGVMDHRTEFAGGLVMPRAIALAAGGVLVGEPPHLWFFKDTDGDDVADEKTLLADDYGAVGNPEHTANALFRNLDNWIYSADHNVRFRFAGGQWQRDFTVPRGQWGMDQDDRGRLYFNSNSDPLRVDLAPSAYFWRAPALDSPAPLAVQTVRPEAAPTFPGRVTPGINRGYQTLDDTWKLKTVTAACAPMIYRGTRFAPEFRGNAFFCEPSGNLVKRLIVEPTADGSLAARNAYADTEFLWSTDERFRPINAYNAPDGSIYILDFYRGIIQHKIYLTTYLRKQIVARGLEAPLGMGRIYRIVPDQPAADWVARGRPALDRAATAELVATLDATEGWWRDTAQRLLVERGDPAAVPVLRDLARHGSTLGRQHALWTLEGLNAVDRASVWSALQAPAAAVPVQLAGLRLSEPWLRLGDAEMVARVIDLAGSADPELRRQAAFALGEVGGPEALTVLARLAREAAATFGLADAVKSSLTGREAQFAAQWRGRADNPVVVYARAQEAAEIARRQPKPILAGSALANQPRPLTSVELAQFEKGRAVFTLCAGCHQPDGRGLAGLAPSLVASKLVERDPRVVARILLHGKEGEGMQMPALGPALDDEAIAAVLTYVRRSFGHRADPVKPATVGAVRETEKNRSQAWTAAELDGLTLD